VIEALRRSLWEIGKELLERRSEVQGHWEGTQFKADADLFAHDALCRALGTIAPGVEIISEENPEGHGSPRPDEYFLIDPIDGTASFAHGFDGWVLQLALMRKNKPVIGAVHSPMLNKDWWAEEGSGAYLNDKLLQMTPDKGWVLTDNYPEPRGFSKYLVETLGIDQYVESGSLGLKTCLVASDTASVFAKDVVVRDWDLAPAHLILREAGGTLLRLNGEDFLYSGSFHKKGFVAADTLERALVIVKVCENMADKPSEEP
jgi:3'(2'), 5'-bisphosphate nucleotidase